MTNNDPRCQVCGEKGNRTESVDSSWAQQGWRRACTYICSNGHRIPTSEVYETTLNVKKSDRAALLAGRNELIEPFELAKLANGIRKALADRDPNAAMALAFEVYKTLRDSGKKSASLSNANKPQRGRIFSSRRIGEEVLAALSREGNIRGLLRFGLIFDASKHRNWRSPQQIELFLDREASGAPSWAAKSKIAPKRELPITDVPVCPTCGRGCEHIKPSAPTRTKRPEWNRLRAYDCPKGDGPFHTLETCSAPLYVKRSDLAVQRIRESFRHASISGVNSPFNTKTWQAEQAQWSKSGVWIEPFDIRKLELGIRKALADNSPNTARSIASQVLNRLLEPQVSGDVEDWGAGEVTGKVFSTHFIGMAVLETLWAEGNYHGFCLFAAVFENAANNGWPDVIAFKNYLNTWKKR